jgi:kynurenine 3-monooxygenase
LIDRSCERVNIVGAGLAGSLLTILLAKRGMNVTVYEKRPDPRVGEADSGRSINLALAARGLRGLERAGVLDRVMPLTIPMRGRMVHERDGNVELQMYGTRPEEVIYSIARSTFNRLLVEVADEYENVDLRFSQNALGLAEGSTRIELRDESTSRVYAADPVPTIATDGAGSPIRRALEARGISRVREEMLDHDYKELTIPAVDGTHVIDPNALHIWPRGGFMLIALPNLDGSFTATLFLAKRGNNSFAQLRSAADVDAFFEQEFPTARALMPRLLQDFCANPEGVLGTIYTDGWHADGSLLLLGDAAHGIVPFHGQGMNCAFEDCVELDLLLDASPDWRWIFRRFEQNRVPDTNAIARMALENYVEMRETVLDSEYRKRKMQLEQAARDGSTVISRYSQVMFHPEIPYREAFSHTEPVKPIGSIADSRKRAD